MNSLHVEAQSQSSPQLILDDCKMNISEDNSLSLTETNKMNVKINSLVSKSPEQFSCLKSTEKRGHSPMQSGYCPYVNSRGYGFNLVVTP